MEDVSANVENIEAQAREADKEEAESEAKRRRLHWLGSAQKVHRGDAQEWMKQMRHDLNSMQPSITELFSPPRVVKEARRFGIKEGHTFDMTVPDPDDGQAWDMNIPSKRRKAWRIICTTKPTLVIGSPVCTPFSHLQNLNEDKGDEA